MASQDFYRSIVQDILKMRPKAARAFHVAIARVVLSDDADLRDRFCRFSESFQDNFGSSVADGCGFGGHHWALVVEMLPKIHDENFERDVLLTLRKAGLK